VWYLGQWLRYLECDFGDGGVVLVIEETSITLFQTWMIISNLSTTSYNAYEKAVPISKLRVKKPSNMDNKIHQNEK
jgi:hypothetical protein